MEKHTKILVSYLERCKIGVNLLINEKSIFEAYNHSINNNSFNDQDIVIFCHDDIEILLDPSRFLEILIKSLNKPNVGFVGPAGTKRLNSRAVWWDHAEWQRGNHRGLVLHGDSIEYAETTYYGNPGRVVVLDGLFLAAKVKTLKSLDLSKPDYFKGGWDFYDIHYTLQAHSKGYINLVAPILLMHHSIGQLAGRDSWHQNREAFIQHQELPIEVK